MLLSSFNKNHLLIISIALIILLSFNGVQIPFNIDPPKTEVYRSDYFVWYMDEAYYPSVKDDITQYFTYLDDCYLKMRVYFGFDVPLPIRVELEEWVDAGGAGGVQWTVDTQVNLGYQTDDWRASDVLYWIFPHELANAFTTHVTRGWPTDWWANSHSPFPLFIALESMRSLGYVDYVDAMDSRMTFDKPFVNMFRTIQTSYGWEAYQRMFTKMVDNEIDLSQIDEPRKSHYVYALLSYGAENDLRPLLREAGRVVDDSLYDEVYNEIMSLKPSILDPPTIPDLDDDELNIVPHDTPENGYFEGSSDTPLFDWNNNQVLFTVAVGILTLVLLLRWRRG